MSLLRMVGACFWVGCGWLSGDWICVRVQQHLEDLDKTLQLLQRLEQEISCRRAELEPLYRTLCREGLLSPEAGCFQNLFAPESFSAQETACFRACVSGLGRTEAVQECERLRLYILRFEAFRAESGRLAQTRVSLSRRLGLGAGLAAAIFFL